MTTSEAPSRPLRILIVEDSMYADTPKMYLREAATSVFGREVTFRQEGGAEAANLLVDRSMEKGEPFDVAIVDLGLGEEELSGLGVIEHIAARSGQTKVIVHSDLRENGRLLFAYAAVHWYGATVAAVMPKIGPTHGEDNGRAFARFVQAVMEGQPPGRWDQSRIIRSAGADAFKSLLGTPEQQHNYVMLYLFKEGAQNEEVASAAAGFGRQLSNATAVRKRLVPTLYGRVADFVQAVPDGVFSVPSLKRTLVPWTARGPINPKEGVEIFAVSQSHFLADPAVARFFRVEKLPDGAIRPRRT